jgi:hypothetical protein
MKLEYHLRSGDILHQVVKLLRFMRNFLVEEI